MNSEVPSKEVQKSGRRRHSRLRTRLLARLTTLTDTYQALMCDLSFFGARVALDGYISPASEAVLCWTGFEVFSNIAWCHGGYCGLEFDEPLADNILIATRDLYDASPRIDHVRVAAKAFVNGSWI